MVKDPSNPPVRRRGRPPSETARQAILQAARELLDEGGPGAVTMEAIAARARVGKPTVYRHWPDRHAVAMAALMATEGAEAHARPGGAALRELRDQLRAIAERFATRTGRHVASMIAAADANSELSKAFRNHFVLARRAEGRALLERAIADGDVRAELEPEVALDLLYGPVFFRLLMGHAPLDAAFMDRVLEHALRGLAAPNRNTRTLRGETQGRLEPRTLVPRRRANASNPGKDAPSSRTDAPNRKLNTTKRNANASKHNPNANERQARATRRQANKGNANEHE